LDSRKLTNGEEHDAHGGRKCTRNSTKGAWLCKSDRLHLPEGFDFVTSGKHAQSNDGVRIDRVLCLGEPLTATGSPSIEPYDVELWKLFASVPAWTALD